ncbi:terminase small subunit [Pseudohongiella spirulinae]|uniref:terminase small subunit n=1 Tax=Pseudohongiella spirulinae TaxID=1249552 RepID=UPI001470206F|nr:terminase small subunit [Pseudohongiella spirulinae]
MARSLGISTQAFDKWGVEPVARQGREAYFTMRDILDNRLAHVEARRSSSGADDDDYDAQRTRLTKEQADKLEMENAVTRREQAPVELLEWALAELSQRISAILGAVPSKIKKRVPSLTSTEMTNINREIIKAQNAASKVELPWDKLPGFD